MAIDVINTQKRECPSRHEEIAAYVEGDLSLEAELSLDIHFASCNRCRSELNDEKRFLQSLELIADRTDEIEIPVDFASRAASLAEINVRGLRKPGERRNAAVIVLALLVLATSLLGNDLARALAASTIRVEQLESVAVMASHLLFDASRGVAFVLRLAALQYIAPSAMTPTVVATSAFLFGGLFVKLLLRFRRA